MKTIKLFALLVFLYCSQANGSKAELVNFSGRVIDSNSGEYLAAVSVIVEQTKYQSTTSSKGHFSINVPEPGSYTLLISRVGYKAERTLVEIQNNSKETTFLLEPSPIEIGGVVVTSQKYVQIEKEVAFPLEIVTQREIEKISPTTVPDILKAEPGIFLQRDGIWATSVSVRGLSKNNLVTLVDGNRIETSNNLAAAMSLIDVADVERVEVIKGSVSSLYGSGATGGVLNILTKGGTYSDELYFGGSFHSSYNSVNKGSKGSVSINASSDNWFAKVSSSLRYGDDVETPDGILDNSQFRDNNISASIGVMPVENHEIKLSAQRFKATDVGIPGGEPFPGQSTATYKEASREMYSVTYSINSLFKPMSNLSVKYFYQEIFRDVEIIPNPNVIVNPSAAHKIHGVQLQTNWVLNQNNFLIAGIDFWQREYDGKRERTIKPKKQIITDLPLPNSKFVSLGFFAQNELKLSDDFKFTLGGRIDRINISNNASYNPVSIVSTNPSVPNPSYVQTLVWDENESDEISWSANIASMYSLTKSVDFTLNIARSFRSPSLEERYQFIELGGTTFKGDPGLNPEKGWFVDAGFRYWGNNFTLRGNAFVNLFNDLVVDEKVNDATFIKTNVGEARLYGFEVSSEAKFIWDIILFGNASYVRGEDTGNEEDLPQIPPLNGIIGIKRSLENILELQANVMFTGDQAKVANAESTTGGYAVYSLSLSSAPLSLGFASFTIHSGIENIFDRAYRNHLSTYRGITRLEPGRNIFVKVNLEW